MATELERELIRGLIEGEEIRPEQLEGCEDKEFARLVAKKFIDGLNPEDFNSYAEKAKIWLSDSDYRTLMRESLKKAKKNYYPAQRRSLANTLLERLTDPEARMDILRLFLEDIRSSYIRILSREEELFLILNGEISRARRFLYFYGFEPTVALQLIEEEKSFNSIPLETKKMTSYLVESAEFSDKILLNSEKPLEDIPLLPLASKSAVISVLKKLTKSEELINIPTMLKNCREELKVLGEVLSEAVAAAKPKPGRPSLEEADELKLLRARARKNLEKWETELRKHELNALTYELTFEAQEKALAKALAEEEAGTMTDPVAVSEISGKLEKAKELMAARAVEEKIMALTEEAS